MNYSFSSSWNNREIYFPFKLASSKGDYKVISCFIFQERSSKQKLLFRLFLFVFYTTRVINILDTFKIKLRPHFYGIMTISLSINNLLQRSKKLSLIANNSSPSEIGLSPLFGESRQGDNIKLLIPLNCIKVLFKVKNIWLKYNYNITQITVFIDHLLYMLF